VDFRVNRESVLRLGERSRRRGLAPGNSIHT
jgi:hypothetical protein